MTEHDTAYFRMRARRERLMAASASERMCMMELPFAPGRKGV